MTWRDLRRGIAELFAEHDDRLDFDERNGFRAFDGPTPPRSPSRPAPPPLPPPAVRGGASARERRRRENLVLAAWRVAMAPAALEPLPRVRCRLCGATFGTAHALAQHARRVHGRSP